MIAEIKAAANQANLPIRDICAVMDLPASTFYRRCKATAESNVRAKARSKRALSEEERQRVLCILHEDRFVDRAPAEVYAALLDEDTYYCSIRTMYRILHENNEVKERRNQLRHPQYKKPELLATAPNQVWSWDITKLKGPAKWTSYYLYVIIDIFSRHAVGWMIAYRENAELPLCQ